MPVQGTLGMVASAGSAVPVLLLGEFLARQHPPPGKIGSARANRRRVGRGSSSSAHQPLRPGQVEHCEQSNSPALELDYHARNASEKIARNTDLPSPQHGIFLLRRAERQLGGGKKRKLAIAADARDSRRCWACCRTFLVWPCAGGMHLNPLLGLICGSVTLTGGPSTALGFRRHLRKSRLRRRRRWWGPPRRCSALSRQACWPALFGGQLIRRLRLKLSAPVTTSTSPRARKNIGFFSRSPISNRQWPLSQSLKHLLILLVCMKLARG